MAKLNVKTEKMFIKKAVIKKVRCSIPNHYFYMLKVHRRRYYELKKRGLDGIKIKTSNGEEFHIRINIAENMSEECFLEKKYIDVNFDLFTIGKFSHLYFKQEDITEREVTPYGTRRKGA